jgi:hypothetical protein
MAIPPRPSSSSKMKRPPTLVPLASLVKAGFGRWDRLETEL